MPLRSIITRNLLQHVLAWMMIGCVWYYLRYQDYSTPEKALLVTVIKTVDLALMVYLCNYLLIPFLLYQKRYVLFTLSFLTMIVLSSTYKMYLIGKLINNPALLNWSGNIKTRIYDNMIPHLFLVIAGVAFKLLFDFNRVQKRLAEVARERAEAELNFLKSQINPHFLFNSLNSVYFLIDKSNTEARNALHKFSDMLRYQLYELKGEKISIEKEISYLEDYISLQQLRRDNCAIRFVVDPHMKGIFIEPLLLIPFVENSFKHLSHYGKEKVNVLNIDLGKKQGSMYFNIRNTTEIKTADLPTPTGGIGLVNVKRRLELLYPRKHELQIREENGWFDVMLTLQMDW